VRAVLLVFVTTLALILLGLAASLLPATQSWSSPLTAIAIVAAIAAVAGAPAIFGTVYLLVRLFGGLGGEYVLRGGLNSWVAELLRGIAFGKDGDQRLGDISPVSHSYAARQLPLDGPLAERLQANAAKAAAQLIERYRWALFTVGGDTNATLSNLATDAMTWDSLIHTTYFDHPELADYVASYIIDSAKQAA
jgi:hypothetical protein